MIPKIDVTTRRRALLKDELHRYLDILIEQYVPDKILLFGSMADDETHAWSDLDLVIVKKTDKRFLDRIKEVLQLLQPRAGVDILVYTPEEFENLSRDRTFFREEIIGKGTVLYEK